MHLQFKPDPHTNVCLIYASQISVDAGTTSPTRAPSTSQPLNLKVSDPNVLQRLGLRQLQNCPQPTQHLQSDKATSPTRRLRSASMASLLSGSFGHKSPASSPRSPKRYMSPASSRYMSPASSPRSPQTLPPVSPTLSQPEAVVLNPRSVMDGENFVEIPMEHFIKRTAVFAKALKERCA